MIMRNSLPSPQKQFLGISREIKSHLDRISYLEKKKINKNSAVFAEFFNIQFFYETRFACSVVFIPQCS